MKCPHCLVYFNDAQTWWSVYLGKDTEGHWILERRVCPTCEKFILHVLRGYPGDQAYNAGFLNARFPNGIATQSMVLPKGISRSPVPKEVPPGIVEDYKEACLVLDDSPKASAALSRRCLQNVLRQAAGVKHGDLSNRDSAGT